jgi:archaeal type IV pilus assembly protein PilA
MNFRKMKKNFRKNRKAISPVIATLLMIAIAVVASLVTYAWVMGYMGFTTSKTGKAIQIQSVANDTSTTVDQFSIYVQNVGDSTVKLLATQSIYINGTMLTTGVTAPTGTFSITPTTTTTINIAAGTNNLLWTPASGEHALIKLTTVDGTQTQYNWIVP